MSKAIAKTTLSIQKNEDGTIVISGTVDGVYYAWSTEHQLPWVKSGGDATVEKAIDQINKFGSYFSARAAKGADALKQKASEKQVADLSADDLSDAPAKKSAKKAKAEEAFGFADAV